MAKLTEYPLRRVAERTAPYWPSSPARRSVLLLLDCGHEVERRHDESHHHQRARCDQCPIIIGALGALARRS